MAAAVNSKSSKCQLEACCIAADATASTSYDENWEHVARKGKSNVTRGQEDVHGGRTLTSQIFGGAMQSTVKAARAKASVTVQPFNLLHLDIQGVNNVTAALQMLTKPEDIHGECFLLVFFVSLMFLLCVEDLLAIVISSAMCCIWMSEQCDCRTADAHQT